MPVPTSVLIETCELLWLSLIALWELRVVRDHILSYPASFQHELVSFDVRYAPSSAESNGIKWMTCVCAREELLVALPRAQEGRHYGIVQQVA